MIRRFLVLTIAALLAATWALSEPAIETLPYQADQSWPQLPEHWNLRETAAVAADAKDHVYVFHRGLHPIIEFDPAGKFVRSFGEGLFDSPHGLRIDPEGNIWAVDNAAHVVVKMDPKGRVRMVLGRRGTSGETEDLFFRPTDVTFAPNGDFFVSDGYGNSRVVKFAKNGKFIKAWGKRGVKDSEFNTPHSVVVDKSGRLLVADRENFRIQIFDQDGKFLQKWGHVGSPWGLALHGDNTLFMSDGYNNRILKLDLDGRIVGSFGSHGKLPGELELPHQMTVDSRGAVYVGEITNWRAQKFVAK